MSKTYHRHKNRRRRSKSSTSYDYDGWYNPEPLKSLVKNISPRIEKTQPGKVYNWVFRSTLTPEPVWIPITSHEENSSQKDDREFYEFAEYYMRAVQKKVQYRKIKRLTLHAIEKAAIETANFGHGCPVDLVTSIKEYLVNFLTLASKSDDNEDLYSIFKKGLFKITQNYKVEKTDFIMTAQDTSIFSNRSQQEPTSGYFPKKKSQKNYQIMKGDPEDYTTYWKDHSGTYHPSSKMFY